VLSLEFINRVHLLLVYTYKSCTSLNINTRTEIYTPIWNIRISRLLHTYTDIHKFKYRVHTALVHTSEIHTFPHIYTHIHGHTRPCLRTALSLESIRRTYILLVLKKNVWTTFVFLLYNIYVEHIYYWLHFSNVWTTFVFLFYNTYVEHIYIIGSHIWDTRASRNIYTHIHGYTHLHFETVFHSNSYIKYMYMYTQWRPAVRMGLLRFVGSLKLQVSFAEYRLFHRALLQKRRIIRIHLACAYQI